MAGIPSKLPNLNALMSNHVAAILIDEYRSRVVAYVNFLQVQ